MGHGKHPPWPPYWGLPNLGYGAQNFRPAGQNRVFWAVYKQYNDHPAADADFFSKYQVYPRILPPPPCSSDPR